MRLVRQINEEETARLIGDLLYTHKIDNQVDRSRDGKWEIWVIDDDKTEAAAEVIDEVISNPDTDEFRQAGSLAAAARKAAADDDENYRKTKVFGKQEAFRINQGTVTIGIIILSVTASLLSQLGADLNMFDMLAMRACYGDSAIVFRSYQLPEIMAGEIWRLITPIFMHLGPLHLLFNMMWTYDLGTMLERKHGPWRFLAMVLLLGIASNLGQLAATGSAAFGGMSGVVYGLFGYIWIRGKVDPFYEVLISQQTTSLMLIWFIIGYAIPSLHIANWAHASGLGLGVVLGFVTGRMAKAAMFRRPS